MVGIRNYSNRGAFCNNGSNSRRYKKKAGKIVLLGRLLLLSVLLVTLQKQVMILLIDLKLTSKSKTDF